MTASASVRLSAALALVVCVAGCAGDPPTQPPPGTYLAQTTPAATFANLRRAYNTHDAAARAPYAALFDSTRFTRYFAGAHPAGHAAPSWDFATEVRGFDTFVSDPTLVSYAMTWGDSASAQPAPSPSLADPAGTLRYTFTRVTIDIEHTTFGLTQTGSFVIDVAPVDTVNGAPEWRIVRWRDATGEPAVPPSARPLTTPYAPLANLDLCYRTGWDQSVALYRTLFDSARYVFVWDDTRTPQLEDTYGYASEVTASGVFADPSVTSVSLTFLVNVADSLGQPSNILGDPPGAMRFTINGISLSFDRSVETYVTSGAAEFFTAPTDTLNGVPQWRIIRWRDLTAPPITAAPHRPPVEPTTWGEIKALYLQR